MAQAASAAGDTLGAGASKVRAGTSRARTIHQPAGAAPAAGGRDNGEPGVRPNYHPNYYGAFVLDPDGYNIEAVCHKPEVDKK